MNKQIKGVGEDGYPIRAYSITLPVGNPLPMWCDGCGAGLSWCDLGVLHYAYPDCNQRVFICSVCGKFTVNYREDKREQTKD